MIPFGLHKAKWQSCLAVDRTLISRHVNNCFKEGELDKSLVCAKFAQLVKSRVFFLVGIMVFWIGKGFVPEKYGATTALNRLLFFRNGILIAITHRKAAQAELFYACTTA